MVEPIQVLLVDDSVFVHHGFTTIFEASENIVIVGTAQTQGEAIRAVKDCRPDVVLLDV
jgi:chemotaxis response regulator CheB